MVRFVIVSFALIVTASLGASECFAQKNNNKNKSNAAQETKDDQKIKDEKEDVKKLRTN